jgi:hypothetical protein
VKAAGEIKYEEVDVKAFPKFTAGKKDEDSKREKFFLPVNN